MNSQCQCNFCAVELTRHHEVQSFKNLLPPSGVSKLLYSTLSKAYIEKLGLPDESRLHEGDDLLLQEFMQFVENDYLSKVYCKHLCRNFCKIVLNHIETEKSKEGETRETSITRNASHTVQENVTNLPLEIIRETPTNDKEVVSQHQKDIQKSWATSLIGCVDLGNEYEINENTEAMYDAILSLKTIVEEQKDNVLEKMQDYRNESKTEHKTLENLADEHHQKTQEKLKGLKNLAVEYSQEMQDKLKDIHSEIKVGLSGSKTMSVKNIKLNFKKATATFRGRGNQLEAIAKHLLESNNKVVITAGQGGIGTEIARKYAESHDEYYEGNIIWIASENSQSLATSFHDLAKLLNISTSDNNNERPLKSIIEACYRHFQNSNCLFIFDNVDDIEHVKEYLYTVSNQMHILITSRIQTWSLENTHKVSLYEFSEEEAEEYLRDTLKIIKGVQEEDIKTLTKKLQYLPLALKQAVSYIRTQKEMSKKTSKISYEIKDYLTELDTNKSHLLSWVSDMDFYK